LPVAWLCPVTTSLGLIAIAAGWTGYRLFDIVRRFAGLGPAVVAVILFLTSPLVVRMSSVVMLDIVIAALTLEFAFWLARYAETGSTRAAVACGVFAALAFLTKGNGVAVVLVVLVFIAITRRFDLFRQRGLYIAAAIVLTTAAPVLALSAFYDARIGDFGFPSLAMLWTRTGFYAGHIWRNLGSLSVALAAAGAAAVVAIRPRDARERLHLPDALLALAVGSVLFHVFNPHIISVQRYITMTIAPLTALAVLGAHVLVSWATGSTQRTVLALLLGFMIVTAAVERPRLEPYVPLGYRNVITRLDRAGALAGRRVLVVSDEVGEGAAVTEAAMLGLTPAPTIIRGSKLLATGGWVGPERPRFESSGAVMQNLEDLHVDYVIVDRSDAASRLAYFDQVTALAANSQGRLDRVADDAHPPFARPLELYRVTSQSPGPAKPLRIDIEAVGTTLQR
jgi:hypothetical protein